MSTAAPLTWDDIQSRIWDCDHCATNPTVAYCIRQRTGRATVPVRLLLIGVAPPHVRGVTVRTAADSATNDPSDNLRRFVERSLGSSWDSLVERGLFLIHGVKCAIVPKDHHQNPKRRVVDACAPRHFALELEHLRPERILALGGSPFRALRMVPGLELPPGLGLSTSVGDLISRAAGGVDGRTANWRFKLHISPFPSTDPSNAERILREAAAMVGLL